MNKNDAKAPQFPEDTTNGPSIDTLQSRLIQKQQDSNVDLKATIAKPKKSKGSHKAGKAAEAGSKEVSDEAVCSRNERQDFSAEFIRKTYDQDVACLAEHFNALLAKSPLASGYLPLNDGNVIDKLGDGVLLCAMANALKPGTVDEAAVVRDSAALEGPEGQDHTMHNVSLGLMSLQTLGVYTDNITVLMICSTNPLCLINLLIQVLRLATVCKFNLKDNEQLLYIFDNWSDKEELINIKNMSRTEVLRQWVNYQLRKGGTDLELKNFATSLADSVIYAHLLRTVAPEAKKASLKSIEDIMVVKDLVLRASLVVNNASILGIIDVRPETITPEHIAGASKCGQPNSSPDVQRMYILNLAFLSRIYSRYPNIDAPRTELDPVISEELKGSSEKGFTEETQSMWLNSFGPEPSVAYLFTDLCSGAVLLQVWESISPGCVNWSKVDLQYTKMPKRKLVWMSNCAEVMECAKKHGIKVNCSASDIATGEIINTLALVFAMMQLHSQLHRKRLCGSKVADLDDKGLVMWFNKQINQYGSSFQLQKLGDSNLGTTNALGYLGERVLTEHGRINNSGGNSGTQSWLFDSVHPVSGNERKKYSSSATTMFRKGGVSVFISQLHPEVDSSVYKGVLLQLNALYS